MRVYENPDGIVQIDLGSFDTLGYLNVNGRFITPKELAKISKFQPNWRKNVEVFGFSSLNNKRSFWSYNLNQV